jgi:iron complex outermembrane receptor protein
MRTAPLRLSIASALLFGTALSTPAFAQDGGQPAADEETGGIEAIVVTARKTSESIQTTPVAVSALSANDLAKQQITNVTQLQNSTPNLTFSSAVAQPGSATIFIRGQGSADGLIAIDQAIGAYQNGVYLARSTGGAFEMVDVQRVEVLRGPQGTLFGRNTTGGAINVIPNEPTGEFEGSLRADYGNFDAFLGRVVLNLPLKGEELAFRVAYQRRDRDGFSTDRISGRQLNDLHSDYVRATAKIAPADTGLKILLSVDYSKFHNNGESTGLARLSPASAATGSRDLLVGLCNGALTGNFAGLNGFQSLCSPAARGPLSQFLYDGPGGTADIYSVAHTSPLYGKSESRGATAIVEYDLTDNMQVKSTTAWRGVRLDSLSDNDGTPYQFTGGFAGSYGNRINQDQFSQELQLSGKAGPVDYILGGFYFIENGTDRSLSGSLFPLSRSISHVDGTVRNQSTAGFGQLIFHVTDSVRLTGGVRYTEDKRRLVSRNRNIDFATRVETTSLPLAVLDGDATDPFRATFNRTYNYWSWLASVDWQPTDGVFLYAKASRSQRSGGFNTRVVAGGIPPISFRPEEITDYEAGAKIDLFDRRVRINLAAFHDDVKDVQRNIIGTVGTTLISGVDNAAKAKIQGMEAELTVIPFEGLTLGGNFGLTDASYPSFINSIDGSDYSQAKYPYTPKYTYSLKADYEYPVAGLGTFKAHLDYAWRSAQWTSPIQLAAQARVGLTPDQIAAGNAAQQDTAKINAYGVLNGRIAFQLEDPDLEIALYAQNITKKKYFTRLLPLQNTPFGLTSYLPGDPQTYGVSATFKF